MILYLHIGPEKTGSSFIQTTAARNRDILLKNGIFYPTAGKREMDMIQGKISPGNGKKLFESINDFNLDETKAILTNSYNQAKNQNCKAILVSNENLIELSLKNGAFHFLQEIAYELNFSEIRYLTVLRDPLEQALSLYKHRAKSGNIVDADYWIRNNYFSMKAIEAFYKIASENFLQVCYRKYKKESSWLVNLFFNDWLEIKDEIKYVDEAVNPSLTLSELILLKNQLKINPILVPEYYNALLKIPIAQKASDKQMMDDIKSIFQCILIKYNKLISQLNDSLPDNEFLPMITINQSELDNGKNMNNNITLSEVQLNTLLNVQHNIYSIKGQLKSLIKLFKSKLLKTIGK